MTDLSIILSVLSIIVLAVLCGIAMLSRGADRRALVETNAMLQYCLRRSIDAALVGRDEQIDRIQAENNHSESVVTPRGDYPSRNDMPDYFPGAGLIDDDATGGGV